MSSHIQSARLNELLGALVVGGSMTSPRQIMDMESTAGFDRVLTIMAIAGAAIWRIRTNTSLGDWRVLVAVGLGFLGAVFFIVHWEGLTGQELWDSLKFNFPIGKGNFGISRRCLGLAYVFLGVGAIEFIKQAPRGS
jgi:hypothetical protein